MLIIGLCPSNIESALKRFNAEHNTTIEAIDVVDKSSIRRTATKCRLIPHNAADKYGRRGQMDRRRIKALCWHGFRDFFAYLFECYDPEDNGEIEIRTAAAKYRSKSDFERQYPETDRNIGSQMHPVMYSEACDCGHNV